MFVYVIGFGFPIGFVLIIYRSIIYWYRARKIHPNGKNLYFLPLENKSGSYDKPEVASLRIKFKREFYLILYSWAFLVFFTLLAQEIYVRFIL